MLMVVLNTASTHHSPDKDWLRFKEKETCDKKSESESALKRARLLKAYK